LSTRATFATSKIAVQLLPTNDVHSSYELPITAQCYMKRDFKDLVHRTKLLPNRLLHLAQQPQIMLDWL